MKKFLSMLFAVTLIVACGKGKEPSKEAEEDDNAPQTSTVASSTSATAPAAATAAAPVSADAATLTGVIKLAAAAPAMPTIQMSADPYCQSQHPTPAKDEEVVVGPGGELANVFVYVKNAPAGNFPPPSTPVTLDQKGCQYHPHVGGIMVGQPLEIKNSDTTLHNVHAMPNNNTQFNEGQPVPMSTTKKFDKAELVPFRIKCDVHGWMKAWMAVMPHPFFAVSQMNGSFTIPNLPPGTYTIVAWHEKYGPKEQQVTVAAKESKALSFSF
ncbi:MAG TPA: carboxypeptidase regulatory-like domain-containing protein [Thermoanaerobaculia bacterium]|nr:carboxypeptidase regulatory-like domain-containing protein [Thermoanaerobaculia bacterium]